MLKQPTKYQVFIVEDHLAMRNAYVALIAREPNLEICGLAATATEALQKIPECNPDIALIDVSLDGVSGIELIEQLQNLYPELLTLIISGHEESFYAQKALEAGARGYIMKQRVQIISQAIQDVLNGKIYLSTQMKKSIFG